jgi:hypothetical protein
MKRHAPLAIVLSIVTVSCAAMTAPLLASAGPGPDRRQAPVAARVASAEPLSIDVYPRVASDGDQVSVRMRIEPNQLSRSVEVSWWSTDGLGGSRIMEIDGDRAAIRYEFPIKRIDAGEYEVSAVLLRADGTRVRRSVPVLVVGRPF